MFNELKSLLTLGLTMLVLGFSAGNAAAALCADGQEMVRQGNQPACTCRPPLKYLPGNICGSGKKAAPKTNTGTTPGVNAICEIGMVPEASGCRCQAPLKVLPGGRCGVPTAAGAACREGESVKATHCKCNAPLMQSTAGARNCIRCLPGDGDKIVGGRCRQNVKKR